ncbi:MAG: sulfurtransferase TusA family protein [Cyanobacteriota bacterium]|nr:sulfurtransferase TusA family protein [Cyanobacteriota bacterium]
MSTSPPAACLDLRGTPCPLNYVRARLTLEAIPVGAWLQVDLDPGEPEDMVTGSLRGEGHHVISVVPEPVAEGPFVRLLIQRGA